VYVTSAQELRQAVDQAKNRPTVDQIYTRLQQDRVAAGLAAGQCAECGSYRSDGQLPVLHQPNCSRADDWQALR
jgi:hypothetical protein